MMECEKHFFKGLCTNFYCFLGKHVNYFDSCISGTGRQAVDQDGVVLSLHLINAEHDRVSTVLTSNKSFKVLAAALIDRLVHHRHIFNTWANSDRMQDHQYLLP